MDTAPRLFLAQLGAAECSAYTTGLFAFLPSLLGDASLTFAVLAGGYLLLIVVVTCAALFSAKPDRQQAAYAVLLVLTQPRRRRPLPGTDEDRPVQLDPPRRRAGRRPRRRRP